MPVQQNLVKFTNQEIKEALTAHFDMPPMKETDLEGVYIVDRQLEIDRLENDLIFDYYGTGPM